jgi:hypothetical protein
MSAIDPTLSAGAKVERAEKHIEDFNIERGIFLKSNRYRTVAYDEAQTGDRVIKMKVLATTRKK